ncbi:hypothetical protein JW826_03100 [Candidatus Woesearchaeota archaeon]|nr:hypothetical protein [Candidatus Woesearchaeota archaeon]
MENDISNRTIVVLVLLTVIISVLSTLVVLNEVYTMKMGDQKPVVTASPKNQGQISLEIKPQKSVSEATGRVAFEIKPKSS